MRKLSRIFVKRAVRVVFLLVIAFVAGVVVMTARFVLLEQGPADDGGAVKRMTVVDRDRFELVTDGIREKTSAPHDVDPAIRDPFSPPPVLLAPAPAPPPEEGTPEAESGDEPSPVPDETQ